jgi:hypothetical protein
VKETKIYTIIVRGKNIPEIDKVVEEMKKKFKDKAKLDIVRHEIVKT